MRSLVNKSYQQILATGKVGLFKSYHPGYKDGEQKRDFLYVKDAVEMTLHFAEKGEKPVGFTPRLRSGEHLAHADECHLRRACSPAEDRLHRDARGASRQIPNISRRPTRRVARVRL